MPRGNTDAHIGYYVGQLHFYHSSYGLLTLTFLGALADGTGLLPGVADGASRLAQSVFSVLFVLFFGASLLPLVMMLLAEQGPSRSLLSPLAQLISGSPLFFIFKSCATHAPLRPP